MLFWKSASLDLQSYYVSIWFLGIVRQCLPLFERFRLSRQLLEQETSSVGKRGIAQQFKLIQISDEQVVLSQQMVNSHGGRASEVAVEIQHHTLQEIYNERTGKVVLNKVFIEQANGKLEAGEYILVLNNLNNIYTQAVSQHEHLFQCIVVYQRCRLLTCRALGTNIHTHRSSNARNKIIERTRKCSTQLCSGLSVLFHSSPTIPILYLGNLYLQCVSSAGNIPTLAIDTRYWSTLEHGPTLYPIIASISGSDVANQP